MSNSSGIYDITLYDNSELLYLDGITEEITLYGHSTASLKGGRVDYITSYHLAPNYPCQVTIYCQTGYQMNQSGISGLWADGSSFDIEFIDPSSFFDPTWESINIVEVIPEPVTLALLGLGYMLIRKRK